MDKYVKAGCLVLSMISLLLYIFEKDQVKKLDHLLWAVLFQVSASL